MSDSPAQYLRRGGSVVLPAPGTPLLIQPLPGIGDMVWHLPHIHALARHHGQPLWILTKRRSRAWELLSGDQAVAGFLWLERKPGEHDGVVGMARLVSLLKRGRFGSAWVLHDSARYAWAARMAGIPYCYGYGFSGRSALTQSRFLAEEDRDLVPFDKAHRLLDRLGVLVDEYEPRLPVLLEARQAVERYYADCPKPWIALGIGSSEPYKQWGMARFAALSSAILDHDLAKTVFVIGGPSERLMAKAVLSTDLRPGAVSVIGEPLQHVSALLSNCCAYIGNDTGVLNMAAALGVKSLGLFGGSPPLQHSPLIQAILPSEANSGMAGISVASALEPLKIVCEEQGHAAA